MRIRIPLLILAAFLFAPAANATLMLTISDAGSGNTLWTFSGSDTASYDNSPILDFDDDLDINATDAGGSHWNLGDFSIGLNDTQVAPISTTAMLTIGATTRGIDDAYIDTDTGVGSAGFDDIGVGVTGTTNFPFSSGDLISWTGSMTVAINISSLILGTYISSVYGGEVGALDLQVNIVPEPSTAGMLALGLGVLALRGRRGRD